MRFSIAFDDNWSVASPTWTRLDETYTVTSGRIDRGRVYETDRTDTGRATVTMIDKTGAFDPLNATGTFYGKCLPRKQAKIEIVNPVTSAVNTVFRGFITSWRWQPHQTERWVYVTIDMVDGLAVLAETELVPDGSFGNSVVDGNIVYSEDSALTAVRTRINKVLTECGVPTNGSGTDGVANGTTTFTSASASFATTDVGKFISIESRGRFQITARNSATSIELSGSPATATGLVYSYGMRDVFSGNVGLQATTYAPRASALSVILDAADAEFPTVANFVVNREGQYVFRGRYTRFAPATVDYDVTTWELGDDLAAQAAPSTIVPIAPPLTFYIDESQLYTAAIATPQEVDDSAIAGQYVDDATTIAKYGTRTWSAENLLTRNGEGPTTAVAETLLFATHVVNNYKTPAVRVEAITVRPKHPSGTHGAATWAFLCGVELNDLVELSTTLIGGGGFTADEFFVEGIHYDIKPMNASYDEVTVVVDVSPKSYYASNPFAGP